ncbi:hypothetical protein [Parapedobacter sp. 10938]|uniref:hypothetical protein n=1 Tax=Parapedobacter flavus TaxID=3110225 RepID=UPI002DBEF788|nr:hypothetical protein [Parapedobacter sp. 10938]MEC3878010.1 hypothetical protein [Parapedobacter sp. 10938]
MVKRYRMLLIGLVIAVFGTLLVQDFLQRRGAADLKGGFEEIAFARNEQNKGGIVRIYAFSVADTVDADYQGCGELLPHNDYGSVTKAYFFQAGQATPQSLRLEPPHFDTVRFHPVAVYLKGKDGVGNVEGPALGIE